MLIIKNINIGQFGNKILYYNNLVQVAKHFNCSYYAPRFEHDNIFDFVNANNPESPSVDINSDFLINNKNVKLENQIFHLTPCLGDLFFEFDLIKTNEIFKFNDGLIPPIEGEGIIAIHFRGKDFHVWDPKSILSLDYYIEGINEFENVKFKLFTDDLSMFTYNEVKKYLTEKGLEYELGDINDLVKDFISMSYCDGIISAPSTFSIAAGFCGKENKKIIHSKNWVDYQMEKGDKFWVEFNNGGNNNYKKYKII